MATQGRDRAVALSQQLVRAHQELRDRLRDARTRPGSLTAHCLAFCAALTAHHQGEDSGLFTELLRERPDLAGVVTNLVEDHEMISSILARVGELAEAERAIGAPPVPSTTVEPGAPVAGQPPASGRRTAGENSGRPAARTVAAPGPSDEGELAARRAAIQRELDGLSAIMENHFRYEERAISAALDAAVADTGWSDQVFRFRPVLRPAGDGGPGAQNSA